MFGFLQTNLRNFLENNKIILETKSCIIYILWDSNLDRLSESRHFLSKYSETKTNLTQVSYIAHFFSFSLPNDNNSFMVIIRHDMLWCFFFQTVEKGGLSVTWDNVSWSSLFVMVSQTVLMPPMKVTNVVRLV